MLFCRMIRGYVDIDPHHSFVMRESSSLNMEELNNHALRPRVMPWFPSRRRPMLGSPLEAVLALQDEITPTPLGTLAFLANASIEDLHPAFLVSSGVGIEINDFAVVESNSETFFNKHVSFLFLGKSRLASFTTSTACLLLGKCAAVVNQFASIREVDCRTRLSSRLMVCCELASDQLEVSTSPVLLSC